MRFEVTHHHNYIDPVVRQQLDHIRTQLEILMSLADDLKTALTDLGTAVNEGITEIETLLTKIGSPGTSDADVTAAITQAQTIAAGIRAEVDKAKAAAP